MALKGEVLTFMSQPGLSFPSRQKLDESFVKIMELSRAWWKNSIGDLIASHGGDQKSLKLLALIPAMAMNSKDDPAAYKWHHEIKAAAPEVLDFALQFPHKTDAWLELIRSWTAFGAFKFPDLISLLPSVFSLLPEDDDAVLDILSEICELPTRDEAEEAKKVSIFVPFLLHYSQSEDAQAENLAKIVAALTESCANTLIARTQDPQIQDLFRLLLKLTAAEGVPGVDDESSPVLLNSWYYLCEAALEIEEASIKEIYLAILSALIPALLSKATLPIASIWSQLLTDQRQQFMQLRRDFLDTFLYVQRVFQSCGSDALLQTIYQQLSTEKLSTSEIEVRLRTLIVVAEECEEWNAEWSALVSLLFTKGDLIADIVNAKLAISLLGSLLPSMAPNAAEEAVQMFLAQLDNPSIGEECLNALQRAADCEVACLQQVSTIIQLAARVNPQTSPASFIRFLTRLISDLPVEQAQQQFNLFCELLLTIKPNEDLLVASLKAFKLPQSAPLNASLMARLRTEIWTQKPVVVLSSALELFSQQPPAFYLCFSDNQNGAILACQQLIKQLYQLGSFVEANSIVHLSVNAWKGDALPILSSATQLLLSTTFPDLNSQDEAFEPLLEGWCSFLRSESNQFPQECSHVFASYALNRLRQGSLSVPSLRAVTKFIALLIESGLVCDSLLLISVVLGAGMNGLLGRAGMETASRILYECSLQDPTLFAANLASFTGSLSVGEGERKQFLRSAGAAHTLKKFKSVMVEFCLNYRGITQ